MISAFDVYLVMQLDSIGNGLAGFGFLFLIASIPLLGIGMEDGIRKMVYAAGAAAFLSIFCFTACMLLPSSKTAAAAMIILPAITSDNVVEAVKPEAKELYNLAKEAMRSLVEQPKSKEVEK